MDGSWTLPVVSTICPSNDNAARDLFFEIFPELRKLSRHELIIEQVRGLTVELRRKHSCCPATWTSRAYNLLRLGFPELATGDAYKAILLIEHYENPVSQLKSAVAKEIWRQSKESLPMRVNPNNTPNDKPTRTKEYVARASDRAALILAQALFSANCYIECYEFLKCYKPRRFPADTRIGKLKAIAERAQIMEDMSRFKDADYVDHLDKDAQEARRSGHIQTQVYPWSEPFVQREEGVLTLAKTNLSKASNNKCYLGPSSVITPISSIKLLEKEIEALGIKASQDCDAGEMLLVDRTFLSGVDHSHEDRCSCCRGPLPPSPTSDSEATCCDTRFCGTGCKELSHHYHFHLCRKPQDLENIENLMLSGNNNSSDTLASNDLLYRVFAYLENNPATHPLRTPLIGAMTPAYRNCSEARFSWINDIKRPFSMLTMLGADIFKDHALDTWVIQTIQARIRNNIRASTDEDGYYHVSINLLYMFFNHSCDPNVQVDLNWSGGNHLSIKATRPIRRHEELFITYLEDEDLDRSYAERQELLKDWTGGHCQCQRCQRERVEVEDTEQACLPSPPVPVLGDDPKDGDYMDEENFRKELNRYATEMLVEKHPTLHTLRRRRPLYDSRVAPTGDDNISDCDSPARKKRK